VALAFGGASGYAWAFPGPRHVNVGIGVRGKDAARLDALYRAWADGVRAKGLVPDGANLDRPDGAAVPAGAAVDFENHVGKRTVLVGDAGGFASAASGEGIYPGIRSAAIAAQCILKALEADRGRIPGSTCQDQLMTFHTMWRQQMAPHLQMPNVNVTFLLPLIYTNQEIADRFGRAFLFGENL
jgi:flavin-dependent dehydrogenase